MKKKIALIVIVLSLLSSSTFAKMYKIERTVDFYNKEVYYTTSIHFENGMVKFLKRARCSSIKYYKWLSTSQVSIDEIEESDIEETDSSTCR